MQDGNLPGANYRATRDGLSVSGIEVADTFPKPDTNKHG